MTEADWTKLIEILNQKDAVLLVGDNLTVVKGEEEKGDKTLIKYIHEKLLERVVQHYQAPFVQANLMVDADTIIEKKQLPKNEYVMDLTWSKHYDAFKESQFGGDLEHFIKKTINEIDAYRIDYEQLENLLSLDKFKVILSTSYSKDYKEKVEKWANDKNYQFYYWEVQRPHLERTTSTIVKSAPVDGLEWTARENQILFVNLMGQGFNLKRSMSRILVSEEDMILFVMGWSIAASRDEGMEKLSRYLSNRLLLVLGCHVPSWAFRFIWYILKRPSRNNSRLFISSICSRPGPLNSAVQNFIEQFSSKIIDAKATKEFVKTLCSKWKETESNLLTNNGVLDIPQQFSIFVSYASDDLDFVKENIIPILINFEKETGYKFWFDKNNLRPGCKWERDIQIGIDQAALFLVVETPQSKIASDTLKPRYLKSEWAYAKEREKKINKANEESQKKLNVKPFDFILPILTEEKEKCQSLHLNEYQYIEMCQENFEKKLKEEIKLRITNNSQYL